MAGVNNGGDSPGGVDKGHHSPESSSILGDIAHEGLLLGEGVITGTALHAYNGVKQLYDDAYGYQYTATEFSNQKEVDSSWAGKIGEVAGTAGDFGLLTGAARGLAGAVGLTGYGALATSVGVAGALEGSVFTPGDGKTRIENGLIDGGASVVGFGAGYVVNALAKGGPGVLGSLFKVGGNIAGGGTTGAGIAEVNSRVFNGRWALPNELVLPTVFGAAGGALSAFGGSSRNVATAADTAAAGDRAATAAKPAPIATDIATAKASLPEGYVRSPGMPAWDAINPRLLAQHFRLNAASVKAGDMLVKNYNAEAADYNSWVKAGRPSTGYIRPTGNGGNIVDGSGKAQPQFIPPYSG